MTTFLANPYFGKSYAVNLSHAYEELEDLIARITIEPELINVANKMDELSQITFIEVIRHSFQIRHTFVVIWGKIRRRPNLAIATDNDGAFPHSSVIRYFNVRVAKEHPCSTISDALGSQCFLLAVHKHTPFIFSSSHS
ncbi:MAG: hypothetical protein AAF982_08435 [Pseudomonadota bacterium]